MTYLQYIINFLLGININTDYPDTERLEQYIFYGNPENSPPEAKLIIIPSAFFDDKIYGTKMSLPPTPFPFLPNSDIPFLFGKACLRKDEKNRLILYSDIIASAFFMLSRYEEIIKPECRNQDGVFLARDSIVFQQGYGFRPLVDEWGKYLRKLLRLCGVILPEEKYGFSKIFLTHDIDLPFLLTSFKRACLQIVLNIVQRDKQIRNPIKAYFSNNDDPYYSFPWLIEQDNKLKLTYPLGTVESIYFIICKKRNHKNKYFPISHFKYKKLLFLLIKNRAKIGIHISHEGGIDPDSIANEINNLPSFISRKTLMSRNHYLRWREPEHIMQMQKAGIKEDFTLGYQDCIGFRVGTCHPYYFINPKDKSISSVIIHPMEIMECSLCEKIFMDLPLDVACNNCKTIIDKVYENNGELVLLFHNSRFFEEIDYKSLYKEVLHYLTIKAIGK